MRFFNEETYTKGRVRVLANPEWRCPICIDHFECESWNMQANACGARPDKYSRDEIFIAPVGKLSKDAEAAFGYLRVVALAMELNDRQDFGVQDVINAISKINGRYTSDRIPAQSIKTIKA